MELSKKITVITSITNAKDKLLEMGIKTEASFIAYLDRPALSPTWLVRPAYKGFNDPRRNSRIHKILSHQYADSEYTIWLDGNIRLLKSPEELIAQYLEEYDLAVFKHPNRDCIYDESIKTAVKGLDDPEIIIEQAKHYEDSGYAKNKGLCECGIIFRRNTPKVIEFNNYWWSEYCRYSCRDQISFMYSIDKVAIPLKIIDEPFIKLPNGNARRSDNSAEICFHEHLL
jgi:hypothetical protein